MATFNGEAHLDEQLNSILEQLNPEDELIISDDGSSDLTTQIIRRRDDPRIHFLQRTGSPGPLKNFENALSHSTGEILVLADQDDVWLDGKLDIIRQYVTPELSEPYLVVLDGRIVDKNRTTLHESIFSHLNSGPGLLKNIYDNTYLGCCMAFSRPLLDLALPFPDQVPMHDMWLGLLGQIHGTVKFVPLPTVLYRRHPQNVTNLKRQFIPLTQVKRRFWLSLHLAIRSLSRQHNRSKASL